MQRPPAFRFNALLVITLLSSLSSGCATHSVTRPPVKPASTAIIPAPVTAGPNVETPVAKTVAPVAALPTLAENTAPSKPDATNAHIGLILPLNAPLYRQPAEAVKQGVLTAAKAQPASPMVRVYPTTDQVANILSVYQQAIEAGARVIIGPLTKNAVSALAESDTAAVPTLALSVPETEIASANLYLFGLSLDAEARQVAQLAASEGRNSVLIVAAGTALSKRIQTTFSEEWRRLGGQVVGQLVFTPSTDLTTLRDKAEKLPADSIFLATNAQEARLVRPYIPSTIPTYATSLAFSGPADLQKNVDLSGVRFLDMPWMLQPDHPAVMIYPRPEKVLSMDGERLYAMGIDAYRLAQLFYRGQMPTHGVVLDGVTGQISLIKQFIRELTAAEFQADVVVVLDNAKP